MTSAVAAGAWFMQRPPGRRAPTRSRGTWTTFGSVAVLGWSSRPHTAAGSVHGHGEDQADDRADLIGGPHGIWPQAVLVGVEVHNGLDGPLLFSPGQFRLRVGAGGPSVTPYDADTTTESLPAHSTRTTWVSFLTPPDAEDLTVEFTEAGASRAVSTALRPHGVVDSPGAHGTHEAAS